MSEGRAQVPVAVLISGRGSNMASLARAAMAPGFPARICLVVSDTPTAKGLDLARDLGLAATCIDRSHYADRAAFEGALDQRLRDAGVDLVCLAGFMRILSASFVTAWQDKIINIHPSLLPAFKGLETHKRVLDAGVRVTGCTTHIVRPAMDDGPIINQAAVAVLPGDTPDTLAARVLEAEHRLYPAALKLMASGMVDVVGQRCEISSSRWADSTLVNPIAQ